MAQKFRTNFLANPIFIVRVIARHIKSYTANENAEIKMLREKTPTNLHLVLKTHYWLHQIFKITQTLRIAVL